jgi:chemotaxis protein MotB
MAHKSKVVKDTSERWLLTYADLMNLLLILFIILYTFSKVDSGKYKQVAGSLKSVLGQGTGSPIGGGGGGNTVVDIGQSDNEEGEGKTEAQQLSDVKKEITEIIKKEGLQGSVIVQSQERGIVISVRDKVLFKSGSAEIEPGSVQTIEKIGKVLLQIDGKQIRIEGNTDTDPISNSKKFIDNQELSTARANSVWRVLVNRVGLNPKTISSIGYGEYRPLAPNDSFENKAKNRRVDITVLKDKYDVSETNTKEQKK